ncbi:MAG: hypothetical protein IIZ24_02235 [Candidatus Methanomethylophilus sp.]|nr:hypothetical protein [Methanomethylophilus sp.]
MKFSEMKAKMSGLPDGYDGQKAKWNDIKGAFVIKKCCLIRSVQTDSEGNVVCNPATEKPYFDYQLAFYIETEDGSKYNVRTNSRKLTGVFLAQLGDEPKADMVNQYGSEIFFLEPPEGRVRFCTVQQEYGKNKEKHDVAYLEEAD